MTQKAGGTEPPSGDESVLIWPSGWQRLVIPRRRERPGPAPAVAANVVAAYENAKPADTAKVTQALTAPNADPALAAAYRAEAHLPLADVTPTGAAVVATLRWASGSRKPAEARTTVDAWVTARGLEFAVRAVLERCDMMAQETKYNGCSLDRAPADHHRGLGHVTAGRRTLARGEGPLAAGHARRGQRVGTVAGSGGADEGLIACRRRGCEKASTTEHIRAHHP